MDNLGICSICGLAVASGESFINTGPTDWNDPTKQPSVMWVPVDADIHGWSPFVLNHPACWAREHPIGDLVALVDDSHRLLRATLRR
jgi:hypothetical protein